MKDEMRRKDREMDRSFGEAVIDKAAFGVLSVAAAGSDCPYSIPLSIVRREEALYFHGAGEGRKAELFARPETPVRVVFVGDVQVPDLYTEEELEEMTADPKKGVALIRSVFTTQYESAIVEGNLSEVTDPGEKIQALKWICGKYAPGKEAYFEYGARIGEPYTKIYKIRIRSLTAKRKKYDSQGQEMKWGRV